MAHRFSSVVALILLVTALAGVFSNSAYSATPPCWPMNVLNECMEPTDDRVLVPAIDLEYVGQNDVTIHTDLRNVMTISPAVTYIIQITDEQNRTVYLNSTNLIIPSGHLAFVSDYLHNFEKGSYTIEIFVWSLISDGRVVDPLLRESKTRPFGI